MHAIVPAAGLATRMRGLPKFLLPCDPDCLTLMERHVLQLLEVCEIVWIPTTPVNAQLINSLCLDPERVITLPMTTMTMSESVLRVTNLSSSDRFLLAMPDTFFAGEQPYSFLGSTGADLSLACWPIRSEQKGKLGQVEFDDLQHEAVIDSRDKDPNCEYDFFWGAMQFNRKVLEIATLESPHTGFWINPSIAKGLTVHGKRMAGEYFDCGTVSEYFAMLDFMRNNAKPGEVSPGPAI